MKKLIFIFVIAITMCSCKKEWDEYIDISSTGVHIPPCSNIPQTQPPLPEKYN